MELNAYILVLVGALAGVVVMANWLWALICPASLDQAAPSLRRSRRERRASGVQPETEPSDGSDESHLRMPAFPRSTQAQAAEAQEPETNVVDLDAWRQRRKNVEPEMPAERRSPR